MTFWPLTNSDFPTDQTFHQFHDLYTKLDLHRIMSGFHGAFATGVASQQGTLTLPDTWFRPPFWDLLMLQLLRPNSSNLPCLYSTFHLEYPLVLSRFCLMIWHFPKSWPSYRSGPYTDFDLFTKFREVSVDNLQRMWLADRGHLLLWTPGPVPFKTCFLYARLQAGRIMVWWCPSVRPSDSPSARFPHFSHTCFDILSWNFAYDFVLMYYRSSLSVVTLRQYLKELCLFVNLEYR